MKRSALVVASVKFCATAQETLRIKDTVASLRRCGWSVDVLTPYISPLLSFSLDPEVRVFTVPKLPLKPVMMFLSAMALIAKRRYVVMHGFDDGVGVARAVGLIARRHFAYVAEVHHPGSVSSSAVAHAAAVIVPDGSTLAEFREPPPKARVSILPDPHADLDEQSFTAAEFTSALDAIYTYVMRTNPEIERS